MKKFLLLLAMLFLNISFGQKSTTTYYFIRHAEKIDNSKNPELSKSGLGRAALWNKIFSEIDLDKIYSTDFHRTLQTGFPLAKSKKITIEKYDPKTIVIKNFKKETLGKKVLVIGHSNTIPDFINQIIDENSYADMDDSTFGNLYIVTINGDSISHELLKL
jgi:broad specificity phosphatase PhoE